MNKDRINTTIDLVLLMLYLVSSIFLCVQISFINYLVQFIKFILILSLIVLLIMFILNIFVSEQHLIIKRLILVLLTIFYSYVSFDLYISNKNDDLINEIKTYYRLNLVSYSNDISNLNNKTIGTLMNDRNYLLSFEDKNESFGLESSIYKEYHTLDKLINDFNENKIHGMILSDQNIAYLNQRYPEVGKKLIFLSENAHSVKISHTTNQIDINQPFTILVNLSNADDLKYVSSTEHCYLLFVDPILHDLTITKLPSNLYIPNIAYDSYPDALHNVSYNGIDNLLYSIENMINVKIDYFIKLNPQIVIDTISIMDSIIISENDIVDNQSMTIQTTIDDGNIHNYLMKSENDIIDLMVGFFNSKDKFVNPFLTNLLKNFENNCFSNMPVNVLNELLFKVKIMDWDIIKKELKELNEYERPCISYGVRDKFKVSIMDTRFIKDLYQCFLDLKHIELMKNFEFNLNYIRNVSMPTKMSDKIITLENMYWKIDNYFSMLPDSMIHPVEVEKWQEHINIENPKFDPDGVIHPIK